jgi:homoserine kinase type II
MTIKADLNILAAWGIGDVRSVTTTRAGVINHTWLIEAAAGRYVLRGYCHAVRAPVEREHTLLAYACAHGLPAVMPIQLPAGATILERDGRFYALFPHAPGHQVTRAELTEAKLKAMGAFLATMHRALRDFPLDRAARRDMAIDRGATLTRIERLQATIQTLPTHDERDHWALTQLAGRREWIVESSLERIPDLSTLPEQVIHGDYQEDNLFFEGDQVVAVIDWDQSYITPRAWEVVRSLDLTCGFVAERCRAFLSGYRAYAPLDMAELDLAAVAYSLMRAHDLWIYEAIYIAGDSRPRRFIAREPFTPLLERWEAVREACYRSRRAGGPPSLP